jgi:hypothetical protein
LYGIFHVMGRVAEDEKRRIPVYCTQKEKRRYETLSVITATPALAGGAREVQGAKQNWKTPRAFLGV